MRLSLASFIVCTSLALGACSGGGDGGGGGNDTGNNNQNPPGNNNPPPGNNNPPPGPPATFTIGGTASGVRGTGLLLKINGGNELAIPLNGTFVFGTTLTSGQPYNVTVATQPTSPAQTCTVTNGVGTIASSNVADVAVSCIDAAVSTYTISGTVTGLIGSGLVLQNNGGDGRTISGDGPFSFATALVNGAAYFVTVATQPTNPTQQCAVTSGSGTIAGANATNVSVVCAAPPPPPPPPAPASVSPARLFAVHDQGDSRTLRAIAAPGAPLAAGLFIRISGDAQVFGPIFQSGLSDHTFSLTTETQKTLPAGIHSGAITVELCKDDQCAVQYPGSPVSVPYEVRVMSPSPDLKPLSAVPNGKDWQTHGGSAAHTGYVPITIDPATFTRRWKWLPQDPKVKSLSDAVTYQGQAFVTTNVKFGIDPGGGFSAVGIDEATGQTAWVHPFERGPDLSVDRMDPPTVDNGKVYAAASGNFGASVFALNSANGDQIWRSGFTTQGGGFFLDAPTASGDSVISHGGQAGGLVALDATTGVVQWISDGPLGIADFTQAGSVAADGTVLYSVMPQSETSGRPVLRGFDRLTGAKLYSIDTSLPTSISLREPSPTPVITGANSVLIGYWYLIGGAKYRLEKFDTQNRTVSWFVDSDTFPDLPFSDLDPVVANGVVYMVNIALNRIEARNASDGTLLWTWTPPTVDQSPFRMGARMIVTDNLLFAATDRFVYAVSLTSHTDVWSHWNSGTLAMSASGVLYVKSDAAFLDAINLR
jgi:outer membrane protein assembly factor BamB